MTAKEASDEIWARYGSGKVRNAAYTAGSKQTKNSVQKALSRKINGHLSIVRCLVGCEATCESDLVVQAVLRIFSLGPKHETSGLLGAAVNGIRVLLRDFVGEKAHDGTCRKCEKESSLWVVC